MVFVSWVLWTAGVEVEVGGRKVWLWRGVTPMGDERAGVGQEEPQAVRPYS